MESVRQPLSIEFNSDDFDIVEAGQDMPIGIPAEAAPALENSDIKLKNKWGPDLNVAFYIRRRNHVYPQLRNIIINSNNVHFREENSTMTECPVCFDNTILISRYGCSHSICINCYQRCQQVSYTICPLCRHV
jgi:hypothetical protein